MDEDFCQMLLLNIFLVLAVAIVTCMLKKKNLSSIRQVFGKPKICILHISKFRLNQHQINYN